MDVLFVTCRDWLAGAETPALLRAAGCRVDVLCPPHAWPTRGGCARAWFPLAEEPRCAAEMLRRHLETHRYGWIVFGDDPILGALVSRHRERWLDGVLPVDRRSVDRELLGSKVGLARVCARHDLPAPATVIVRNRKQARAAAATLGYPLLLKLDRSSGGTGVFPVDNPAELDRAFPVSRHAVVAQARITGPIWSVEALYDRGRLRACATSMMMQVWPRPFGSSATRRYQAAPALEELAARAGAAIGAHGFANISAVQDVASGRFLLFELDLRVNASLRLAALAGVDFGAAVRGMVAGDTIRRPPVATVTARLYPQDVIRCIEEPDLVGLAVWLLGGGRSLPRADRRLERAYLRFIASRALASVLPAGVVGLIRNSRQMIVSGRPLAAAARDARL